MSRKKHPTAVLLALSAVAAASMLIGAAPAQASGEKKSSQRHVERKHHRRGEPSLTVLYQFNDRPYGSRERLGGHDRYARNRHRRRSGHGRSHYSFSFSYNRGHHNRHSGATIYYSSRSHRHTSACGGGYYKRTWIAPVYGTNYDHCGNPTTYIIHRGYYQNTWVPRTCGHHGY